jgi:hypothetical protein
VTFRINNDYICKQHKQICLRNGDAVFSGRQERKLLDYVHELKLPSVKGNLSNVDDFIKGDIYANVIHPKLPIYLILIMSKYFPEHVSF